LSRSADRGVCVDLVEFSEVEQIEALVARWGDRGPLAPMILPDASVIVEGCRIGMPVIWVII
jgi:hypothetical protein